MIRKNYESDFEVAIVLPSNVENNDLRLEFATRGYNAYIAERINGIYTDNLRQDADYANKYYVVLRNHGLSTGRLKVKVYALLPYGNSPDGIMQEVTPITDLNIELWSGASDEVELPTIELTAKESINTKFSTDLQTEYKEYWGESGLHVTDKSADLMIAENIYNMPLASAVQPFVKMFIHKANSDGDFLAVGSDGSSSFETSDGRIIEVESKGGVFHASFDSPISPNGFNRNITEIYSLPQWLADDEGCVSMAEVFKDMKSLRYLYDGALKGNLDDYYFAFQNCECLQEATIPLSTTHAVGLQRTFTSCTSLRKVTIQANSDGIASVGRIHNAFYDCGNLEELNFVGDIDFGSATGSDTDFSGCTSLTTITGQPFKNYAKDLVFSDSPLLTYNSLMAIITSVASLVGQESKTITLHPDAYARLTEQMKTIATRKNWIVTTK